MILAVEMCLPAKPFVHVWVSSYQEAQLVLNTCWKSRSLISEKLWNLEIQQCPFPCLLHNISKQFLIWNRCAESGNPRIVTPSHTLFPRLHGWHVCNISGPYHFTVFTPVICHADRMSPLSPLTLLTFRRCRKAAASPNLPPPPLLLSWYAPRASSPLPSLSQICLNSKEIHSTFNSPKESAVSVLHLGTHRLELSRRKAVLSSGGGGGGRTLGWRVMRRKLVNLWEIPWALLPPPSNVSLVGAMASQSG